MAKTLIRQQRRLTRRRKAFDNLGLNRKPGFRRPGSMNRHKSFPKGK